MEVWLKDEKNNNMFRFPVIPMPLGLNGGASVDTVSIVKKGNIAIYNGKEPKDIKLDSFFPKHRYSFCNYDNFPSPYECVTILEKWRDNGTLLRYIVTDTPINIPIIITMFDYKHVDGTGNLHYSLHMMEKELIKIPEWIPPKTENNVTSAPKVISNKPRNSVVKNTKKKIHTVKRNEYLFLIAQKHYGNGSLYRRIKNNPENIKRYPTLKKSNIIKVGWRLVI